MLTQVRNERKEAGDLDLSSNPSLMPCAIARYPAGYDLAPIRDVTLHYFLVLEGYHSVRVEAEAAFLFLCQLCTFAFLSCLQLFPPVLFSLQCPEAVFSRP